MRGIADLDKVYVSTSIISNAGRGVFAKHDIKKGEVIESCPIIEIEEGDRENLNESKLVTYFFYFGENKERMAIVLGYGSIYNHSHIPNATFSIRDLDMKIDFVAINDITKDEEITFDYRHGNENNDHPLWFEAQ